MIFDWQRAADFEIGDVVEVLLTRPAVGNLDLAFPFWTDATVESIGNDPDLGACVTVKFVVEELRTKHGELYHVWTFDRVRRAT